MVNDNKVPETFKLSEIITGTRNWVAYLLRKWWLILLVCIVAGVIGILYAYFKKATYESALTFALEEGQGSMGTAFSLAAEFGLNLGSGSGTFNSDNIIGIIKSRRMVEQVLLSLDTVSGKPVTMMENYLDLHDIKKNLAKNKRLQHISYPPGMPREKFSQLQDSVLYEVYITIMEKKLQAGKKDKKSGIYEINFVDTDERFAKVFTEKLIAATIDFYTELRSKKSRETLQILEERTNMLRGSVNSAISTRASTQDANLNPAVAAAQAPIQKKQIDISVYGAAYQELYKNLELARYQYLKDIPLLQVIDAPAFPLKKEKAGRLITGLKFAFIAGFLIMLILSARFMVKNALLKEKLSTQV